MELSDSATTQAAHEEARRLLNSGDYPGAIGFAEALEGNPNAVAHLKAWTFSEVGSDSTTFSCSRKAPICGRSWPSPTCARS